MTLRYSMFIGLCFTLEAAFFPSILMRIFTDDAEIIAVGAEYLRYISLSYFFNGFATTYLCVVRSVERVKMSAIVHASAVLMNIVLNACLIFGLGFFPEMGIAGAALATAITRGIEVAVCLVDARTNKLVKLRWSALLERDRMLMRDFFRYSLPTLGNEFVWSLGFSTYSAILGHLNPDIVAANSVISEVRNLGAVVCFGVAGSGASIMGKNLGANRLKEAEVYAGRLVRLSLITAALGAMVILICRPIVLAYMDLTPQAGVI